MEWKWYNLICKIYMSPILFVLCGLPASGKTTFAHKLVKSKNAILLSEDEWMEALVQSYYNENLRNRIMDLQVNVAMKILSSGVNVVMDAGYWGKSQRDQLRQMAKFVNAKFELHYMKVPLEELKRRASDRNKGLNEEFQTKMQDLEIAFYKFQEPDNAEDFILYHFHK